jgi:serine/alanine adding enzyme
MEVVQASDLNEERWTQFVLGHPRGTIFHTPYLVNVYKGAKGIEPFALAAVGHSHEILALLVAVRMQVCKGPIGQPTSRCIIHAEPLHREDEQGLVALNRLLKTYDEMVGRRALFSEVRFLHEPGPLGAHLATQGYERIEFLNYLIDLRQPPEELWQGMKRCRRNNVRKAQKCGLEWVEITSEQQLPTMYEMLTLTFRQAGIALQDFSFFHSAWQLLRPKGLARFYFVQYDGQPIQTTILLLFRGYLHYWFLGYRRQEFGALRPNDFATWQAIKLGAEDGYELFDWGGAGRPGELYGLRSFKAGFGGEQVNYGRYKKTYVQNPFHSAYKIYKLLQHLKRDLGTLVNSHPQGAKKDAAWRGLGEDN